MKHFGSYLKISRTWGLRTGALLGSFLTFMGNFRLVRTLWMSETNPSKAPIHMFFKFSDVSLERDFLRKPDLYHIWPYFLLSYYRKFPSWLIFSNNVWPVMMVETRFNTSKMHVMRLGHTLCSFVDQSKNCHALHLNNSS